MQEVPATITLTTTTKVFKKKPIMTISKILQNRSQVHNNWSHAVCENILIKRLFNLRTKMLLTTLKLFILNKIYCQNEHRTRYSRRSLY